MLLDKQNIFADNQNVLSTSYSANSIFFGKNDVSYLPVLIQVTTDFAGATSVEVQVETSATAAFLSTTTLCSCTLSSAKLVAGAKFPITHLPKGNLGFMRLKFVVTGTATAGKITAGIVMSDCSSWHDE